MYCKKYRDFLTVKYGHQICPPNTVYFTYYCIFYSKPVFFFLQKTVFFYIKTVKQTKYSFW